MTEREEVALRLFTDYVVQNYPPGCCISSPEWHAPRLFRAALRAVEEAARSNITAAPALAAVGGARE
jgi:hypothetical protein